MKIIFFISFFLFVNRIYSQELVLNGGFEEYALNTKDTTRNYANWKSVLKQQKVIKPYGPFSIYKNKILTGDTSKYLRFNYHTAYEMLKNSKPYEGEYNLLVDPTYIRVLYQTKLIDTLEKDSIYRISLMYKISSKGFSASEVEYVIKSNLGILFSRIDLTDPKINKGLFNMSIHLPFDFHFLNYSFEKNNEWIPIVIDFQAKKDYKFLIIGNNNSLFESVDERPWKYIFYSIDNVSLKKIRKSDANYYFDSLIIDPGTIELQDNSAKIKAIIKKPSFRNTKLQNYYDHIGKAENMIVDKRYKEALSEYCNAFDYKVPFFRDYMNAGKLITNYKVMDSLLTRKFLIASQKVNPNKYPVNERIEYYQNWDTIFRTSYLDFFKVDPSLKNISFAGKIDSTLMRKIYLMSESDQGSRNNRSGIKNIDESNYASILKLYDEYAEISELTVGQRAMQKLNTMFLHFSRYENKDWIDLLQLEVLKGNFDNRTFASLVDSYIENNLESDLLKSYYLTNIGYAHHSHYIIPEIDKKTIDEVNNRRAEIFLESIESQQRKQLYNFRNSFYNFEFYQFFSYDPMYPESEISKAEALRQENEFMKNLQLKYQELKVYDKNEDNYDINFK